jgi:hypothetical protein
MPAKKNIKKEKIKKEPPYAKASEGKSEIEVEKEIKVETAKPEKKDRETEEWDKLITEELELEERKKSLSVGIYRKIAFSFGFLTLALVIAVFYFSFSYLTITITPNEEKVSGNLIIDVYDGDKSFTAGEKDKSISGVVKKIDLEKTQTFSATGEKIIKESAIGKVTIINNYTKDQPLRATTRLLTPDQKLYRIKNMVTVPASGSVEVEIYPDNPKDVTDLSSTKFTIPGLWPGLQDKIYAESKEAIKSDQPTKKYITADDIKNAKQNLQDALLAEAKGDVRAKYSEFDQVISDINDESVDAKVDAFANEEKDQFSITMKVPVLVIAFKNQDILPLAKKKLEGYLPDDRELTEFDGSKITYSVSSYDLNLNMATLNASFNGKMVMKNNTDAIDRNKLVGLSEVQISDYLNRLPEIAGYEIKFSPAFVKKAPDMADRIKVEIKK